MKKNMTVLWKEITKNYDLYIANIILWLNDTEANAMNINEWIDLLSLQTFKEANRQKSTQKGEQGRACMSVELYINNNEWVPALLCSFSLSLLLAHWKSGRCNQLHPSLLAFLLFSRKQMPNQRLSFCVCVCVRERERERAYTDQTIQP